MVWLVDLYDPREGGSRGKRTKYDSQLLSTYEQVYLHVTNYVLV